MPQLRDTEEGPPRTEGVVPLPREAGREGEGAQAPQGVQVLAFTFFSLAYLSAYSLTSGSTMDLSAWYQSETTFHLAPSHWAMRDQSVPRWLSQLVLRSEEHTSELQSPCNLVCRLLLEKKKN